MLTFPRFPERPCDRCGKPLGIHQKLYCSRACHQPPILPTPCLHCKKPFDREGHRNTVKYCSKACYWKSKHGKKIKRTCKVCKATFTRRPSEKKGSYCSVACYRTVQRTGLVSRLSAPIPCQTCKKPVIAERSRGRKYCSLACKAPPIQPRPCKVCARIFKPRRSANAGIYCGRPCYKEARKQEFQQEIAA